MIKLSSQELAASIRLESLRMVNRAKASHIGGALSMADLLAVLYSNILNIRTSDPQWSNRDRLILSKGHSCTALYAALAIKGFFPIEKLLSYGEDGSELMSHVSHKVPGVEFSTGSLGHGLPFACGKALAAKRYNKEWRTFVILSDGELNEGSNWEAILFAPQYNLDNLTIIIDYNKIQSLGYVADVIDLEPLVDKFKSFNWGVKEINGHDHNEINSALSNLPIVKNKPSCLIAHTIKGKGIDFMENNNKWHYSSPNNEELLNAESQLSKNVI